MNNLYKLNKSQIKWIIINIQINNNYKIIWNNQLKKRF